MPSNLYWREITFDSEKRYSWLFHNYSIIINSEVLIHISKKGEPNPNDNSPYFTIPYSSYRDDIRTEPGDRIFYTTRNGGEFSYNHYEINETHNYDIPTTHTEYVINGTREIEVPEGSMVSIQANPERNGKDSFIKYRVGPGSDQSGEFRLYGAQQVAYTFTKPNTITFYSDKDFHLSVLITASQNVSQLSKEMQDKIDKLVADLHLAMENMATKDMLQRVNEKTKRDNFISLPATSVSNGTLSSNYFYNKFKDTEVDIVNGDVITCEFCLNLFSSDLSKFKSTTGVLRLEIIYNATESKILSFTSTDPEITKIIDTASISMINSNSNSDINSRWQKMEVKLHFKSDLVSKISGTSVAIVKSNMVPLKASVEEGVVFDSRLIQTSSLKIENLYQNLVFMESSDVDEIAKSLTIGKKDITSLELSLTEVETTTNSDYLPKTVFYFENDASLSLELKLDNNYHLTFRCSNGNYPTRSPKQLKLATIDLYNDTIEGNDFLINLEFVSVNPTIQTDNSMVTYTTILKPLYKRSFDYIENIINYFKVKTNQIETKIRVVGINEQ